MTLEIILFYILAFGGIITAIMVVTRRNPIVSALYLIANFFCLAGLYLTLHAQFIAIIQIFVYAGAIMVLFVFVIMLLNLGDIQRLKGRLSLKKIIAAGISFAVLMEVLYIIRMQTGSLTIDLAKAGSIGTVEAIGRALFTQFLFPFEVTSLLLIAAIVGAILLAKKKLD